MQTDQGVMDITDEEVARRVQKGDQELFGVLMERYEKKLLRYGNKFLSRKEDVEDTVQDVFMSVYQNIQSFDTTQKFSSWVYRIAHNAFVNNIRKNSKSPVTMFDFDTLISHTVYENPAQTEREQKELKAMLDRALEQVSPKYKEILILYYMEDMSYKDIADILEVPIGTVGIRLMRAKEALKKAYTALEHTHGN